MIQAPFMTFCNLKNTLTHILFFERMCQCHNNDVSILRKKEKRTILVEEKPSSILIIKDLNLNCLNLSHFQNN